ncbi:MAG TPA: hypothetical protein VFP26_02775 [Gemmatimonadaceae bacterium]|jgi:hypothetical protein|nr:hypothetical protein [Gemmatimonadaceae bacterium]
MTDHSNRESRREFVNDVVRLAAVGALSASVIPTAEALAKPAADTAWDLSWIDLITKATDRAVFDWPIPGDPADPQVLYFAERYLDNCAAAYGARNYDARVVLNIRTVAIPIALNDAAWERYALGAEYNIKDPFTKALAVKNPFWHRAPDPAPGVKMPTLEDLLKRRAIVLVCDFALGHLATRLATKAGRTVDEVHRDLQAAFVPQAYLVPSGVFGLARAQNAGCAYMRMV